MKKVNFIKEALLQVIFVSTFFLIAACSNMQNQEDTKEVAQEQNKANFDNSKQEKDAQFMVNAAGINLEEIQLAQLAQQNGTSEHVKELGKMMEAAHTKSLNELTALAERKMVVIPTSLTEDSQEAYTRLSEKTDTDFDKAYADRMVSGHKDAINTFEQASTECNDTEIRNWASASLPGLRKHLDHSMACQKKCESM